MNNYLAVWAWKLPDGRRQEITMSFWTNTNLDAVHIADTWFDRACPDICYDSYTITNLSKERS